jgi:hypothetical protein
MSYVHVLFGLGTLAGISYWLLGISASSHFKNKETSGSDRFLSTAMLWSLSSSEYEVDGQKLCVRGNIALIVAVVSWVSWFMLQSK